MPGIRLLPTVPDYLAHDISCAVIFHSQCNEILCQSVRPEAKRHYDEMRKSHACDGACRLAPLNYRNDINCGSRPHTPISDRAKHLSNSALPALNTWVFAATSKKDRHTQGTPGHGDHTGMMRIVSTKRGEG
jgi:hypothetical protein